jgi:hypothetical protein
MLLNFMDFTMSFGILIAGDRRRASAAWMNSFRWQESTPLGSVAPESML